MARKRKDKTTLGFDYTLAFISIIGFLAIALNSFFEWAFLSDHVSGIILVILSVGLMYEGKLFKIKRWLADGFSSQDFAKLITSIVGVFILIVGVLNLIGMTGPKIAVIEGLSAVIAIIVIAVETFLVK